jgi:hypothetical protein
VSDDAGETTARPSGPFVKAGRRPDIISKLATRAAAQPIATSAAAIAARAANPKSLEAKNWILQSAKSDKNLEKGD